MVEKHKILSVRDMEVRFRVRSRVLTAIRNVSFDVYDQEILAIVGESGSGKSVITKTFTGMLETNGWISQGSIVYKPSETAVEDKNTFFKEPIDIVNLQKSLIANEVIRFVKKRNNKKIKKLHKQISDYLKLNPLSIDEVDSGLELNAYQQIITTNSKLNDQEINYLTEKINNFKNLEGFTSSNKIFKKITKLEGKLQFLEDLKTLIHDKKIRDEKIQELNDSIERIKADSSKVKLPSINQKTSIKKIISLIEKFINTKQSLTQEEIEIVTKYFDKKIIFSRVETELKNIVQEIIVNNNVDEEHFKNILKDWKYISNIKIINKSKSLKEIRQIRGKTISTIFQDPMTSLNPLLSVGFQICEVLKKQLKMSGNNAKKEAIELLRKVGISNPEKRYNDIPGRYSGGMRQRVVIAIALACRPKILICDEPTTALDVTVQAQILKLIKNLQNEYKFSVILITHDLGVVASIADRIAVMYAGQIVEIGTVYDIFENAKHPYTWALLSSLPQLGTKGEELFSIDGTPPSLYGEIKGDAFASRNKYAMKVDYEFEPPMFKISDTHFAKTWLLHKSAPKVEKPSQLKNLKKLIEKSIKE